MRGCFKDSIEKPNKWEFFQEKVKIFQIFIEIVPVEREIHLVEITELDVLVTLIQWVLIMSYFQPSFMIVWEEHLIQLWYLYLLILYIFFSSSLPQALLQLEDKFTLYPTWHTSGTYSFICERCSTYNIFSLPYIEIHFIIYYLFLLRRTFLLAFELWLEYKITILS